MKVGFCLSGNWLLSRPDLVARLDELGYDGVEIWAHAFEEAGIDEVEKIVSRYRFETASVNPYFDFTSSENAFEKSLKTGDEYIEYARRLGCKRIRVFTNEKEVFSTGDDASPEQWDQAIEGVREICDRARPHGIGCVLEVHYGDGQLCDSSATTLKMVQGVGRSNVTVNLQPPLRDETPYESAENLGPHVTHLHAHNWIGGWENLTYLDEGDIDFERFISILRGHGFDGYISIEHAAKNPFGFAEHNIRYLRGLIEKLES